MLSVKVRVTLEIDVASMATNDKHGQPAKRCFFITKRELLDIEWETTVK